MTCRANARWLCACMPLVRSYRNTAVHLSTVLRLFDDSRNNIYSCISRAILNRGTRYFLHRVVKCSNLTQVTRSRTL